MPRVSLGPRRNVSVSPAALYAAGGLVRPAVRRTSLMVATGTSVVPTGFGDSITSNGTLSAPAAGDTVPIQTVDAASGAVLNNTGLLHGATTHRWGNNLAWEAYVVPAVGANNSLAAARWWAGLASTAWSTLLGLDSPHLGGHSAAAFRFSTSAGDGTTWRTVTSGGAGTTVTDTGVTITAGTPYVLSVSDDGAATTFMVNGVVVATHSANRPAAATLMRQGVGVQTLEAVAKSASFGWSYLQHNAA